ncbi:MAG: type VI secretion system baseplate subunit TssK [Polyangiaceae bacterium]
MLRKPIWTEGLLVSQHHFQALDAYHEELLRERIASARRFEWGILDIEVDERLLQSGQFRLSRFAAVWPDGTVVRCGGSGEPPTPEPRAFDAVFDAAAAHLGVFVGMAAAGASPANVADPGGGPGQRRFARISEMARDFNDGGAPQEIDLAIPNVRVFFSPEPHENVARLPVAQLVRQPGGRVIVRDNFVPPTLQISAAPFLAAGLHRILGAMTARQRELAAGRKQRHSTSIEFHFTDARRFWLLHTLNASIPVLAHYLHVKRVHPEEAYLALASLVGQLSTFAPDADPASIPAFDYTALGDVFESLFARVLSLLALDSTPPYTEIPLEHRQDGMFVGKIPEARIANHALFVGVAAGLPEPTIRERAPQLLKIASWTHIYDVVKQARHGVRAEVEWSPSSVLPLKPGLCFFRIRQEGPYWEEIVKTLTLALYVPVDAEWRGASLSVFAVDPAYLR